VITNKGLSHIFEKCTLGLIAMGVAGYIFRGRGRLTLYLQIIQGAKMSLFRSSYSLAFFMYGATFVWVRGGGYWGLTSAFVGYCPPSHPLEPPLSNNLSNQSAAIKFQ